MRRIPIFIILMVITITFLWSFWCTLFPFLPMCTTSLTPTLTGSAGPGDAYVWLAADEDALVRCTQSAGCPDGTRNFGTLGYLDVGRGTQVPDEKRTYIRFYLPQFPPGTEIVDAYINVYENSRQNPQQVTIPIALANDDWIPREITWMTQPNQPGVGSLGVSLGVFRDVNQWRGHSPGIPDVVRRLLANPGENHGFMLNNQPQQSFLRSFASLNGNRSETDLGTAPRLLLHVRTELGLNLGTPETAVGLPPLPNDTDLDETMTGSILMVQIAPGPSWPTNWNLAVQ